MEGEGCFSTSNKGAARLAVAMTDEDVIRRLHSLFGVGNVYLSRTPGGKPYWRWQVATRQARDIMRAVLPFMGKRRSTRIRGILEAFDGSPC